MYTCCADRQIVFYLSAPCVTRDTSFLSWRWSCPRLRRITKRQSVATEWATSQTPRLHPSTAPWPWTNPFRSSRHCKRETCLGSRALGLQAKRRRRLRVGRHLCSYKAPLPFLHLNIVVEKTCHNTQKIQHLFSDGKRLTFPPAPLFFCISTLCCQPPPLCRRPFHLTLNQWFIFLHQTFLVAWWW